MNMRYEFYCVLIFCNCIFLNLILVELLEKLNINLLYWILWRNGWKNNGNVFGIEDKEKEMINELFRNWCFLVKKVIVYSYCKLF